ncbi:hypothetical protein HY009_09245, partial [Candidatus Acetothermia bacterium]|nr:hypothetical protein [Candidatus Acetothermia bacterium]
VNRTCTVRDFSSDNALLRYFWNWGDGTPEVEVTGPNPSADQVHTYAHSGRFTITHRVRDTIGQEDSLALAALANTPPVASNDGTIVVAFGIRAAFEAKMTYYVDSVRIVIDKQ